jgi:hypothetical protein
MLAEVGAILGVRAIELERSMTLDQLRLHWHWKQRADMRRFRMDEGAMKSAVAEIWRMAQRG